MTYPNEFSPLLMPAITTVDLLESTSIARYRILLAI